MTAFAIRIATDSDLPALLALYIVLNPVNSEVPTEERLHTAMERFRTDPNIDCYVAEAEDGRIAGTLVLAILPNLTHGARAFGVIENVVVHPDFRRQGVGRKLMQYALAIAWERDCYKVMLLSGIRRREAHQFYTDLGFESDGKVGFVATPESAAGR